MWPKSQLLLNLEGPYKTACSKTDWRSLEWVGLGPFQQHPKTNSGSSQNWACYPCFSRPPLCRLLPLHSTAREPCGPVPCFKKGFPGTLPFSVGGSFTSPKPHPVVCREAPGRQTVLRGDSEGEIETEGQRGGHRREGGTGRLRDRGWEFFLLFNVSPSDPWFPSPPTRPQWSPSRRGLRRSDCRGMTLRF